MKRTFIINLLLLLSFSMFAQKKDYKPIIVGFYNLENLFDTLDNPNVNDDEFTPKGFRNYNGNIYFEVRKTKGLSI